MASNYIELIKGELSALLGANKFKITTLNSSDVIPSYQYQVKIEMNAQNYIEICIKPYSDEAYIRSSWLGTLGSWNKFTLTAVQ